MDIFGEHSQRIFLDRLNSVKSTCRWVLPENLAMMPIQLRLRFIFWGEALRWTELISVEAIIFKEALLLRNSDGTMPFGSKVYYGAFFPAVDMKVMSLGRM